MDLAPITVGKSFASPKHATLQVFAEGMLAVVRKLLLMTFI